MEKSSIFRIYSMTKPIVSVATMMLVEEGRIQLTDPVSKYLPAMKPLTVSAAKADAEFARITYAQVPVDREMTVQDLLRHTAGLAYGEITQNAPVKEALGKAGLYKGTIDFDARDLTPARGSRTPFQGAACAPARHGLGVQPGERCARPGGRIRIRRTSGRLPRQATVQTTEDERHGLLGVARKIGRLAAPLPADITSGKPNNLIDVSVAPANDSGGAGGVSTAADYLRFTQMLLNGGQLDGARVLSRSSVALMTADHLGTRISAPVTPGELLLGVPGYTFGLGFAVRLGPGVAGVPGSAGEFMWAGYAGTVFLGWIRRRRSSRST